MHPDKTRKGGDLETKRALEKATMFGPMEHLLAVLTEVLVASTYPNSIN